MYVCVCYAVSDKDISRLVESGITDLASLRAQCNAGSGCGMCLCDIKEMVQEARREKSRSTRRKAS